MQFSKNAHAPKEIALELAELEACRFIYKVGDFYSLQNNEAIASRRKKGNAKARMMLETAGGIAGFLSRFPFVRGVAVSGSLSKNFADEESDIDFFIITKRNRLWLARTLMHLFKKFTFLIGRQHLFCMNYYIDEDQLEIKEKNIYTAIEVATLIPLRGIESFQHFFTANKWITDYLPKHTMRISYVNRLKDWYLKSVFEFIFDNAAGNVLDSLLMKITALKWSAKTKRRKLNKRGVVMTMDAAKHYAKPKPEAFQQNLLYQYEQKVALIHNRYKRKLKRIP